MGVLEVKSGLDLSGLCKENLTHVTGIIAQQELLLCTRVI